MKKVIFILAVLLAFSCNSIAREIVNLETTETVTRVAKDTLVTSEKYTDKQGVSYPIIINRNSGRCYIWKKSGNTGKLYKMYMKEEKAREICRKYNVEYK